MPRYETLDSALSDAGLDGYLIDAAGDDSDQRYLSGFDAPDPYLTLYRPDELALLVSELEFGRAKADSDADDVRRFSEFDFTTLREEHGPHEARRRMLAEFVSDQGAESVAVPRRFPVDSADGLRERGVTVEPDQDDVVTKIRAVKTDDEISHIRAVQAANERAMAAAEDLIASTEPVDGNLVLNGEPLTAERVKTEIETVLLKEGCGLDETIVAGGEQGADPHDRGSGPLPANEPIVIDIFPRNKSTKFHGDMTRTVVHGTPSETVEDWFEVTREAFEAALEAIEPGVTGEAVHGAACEVYEKAGFPTLRSDPGAETGFIHNTGHGVGLDVHELPRLAPDGEELEPGHVVTVEPGLYDPAVGGMRLEDLVVVTENGYRNLTDYPMTLQL